MIVLRSPKGWTGPKTVDGLKTEGSWRSHQVPIADMEKPGHLAGCSKTGCGATGPRSCSTKPGASRADIAALAPVGERRMSANPHANGGALMRPLRLPDFTAHAVPVVHPGATRRRGHAGHGRLPARRHAR